MAKHLHIHVHRTRDALKPKYKIGQRVRAVYTGEVAKIKDFDVKNGEVIAILDNGQWEYEHNLKPA